MGGSPGPRNSPGEELRGPEEGGGEKKERISLESMLEKKSTGSQAERLL